MKLSEFQIQSIEFSHDQAVALKDEIIKRINRYGIENIERKIELGLEESIIEYESDPITVFFDCDVYVEHDYFTVPPDEPKIVYRSLKVILKIYNQEGDIVEFKVLQDKIWDEKRKRHYYSTPIDIEEEVSNHFKIG